MKNRKMLVMFEWDEDTLGRDWFNLYNLESCVLTKEHIADTGLLKIKEINDNEANKGITCSDCSRKFKVWINEYGDVEDEICSDCEDLRNLQNAIDRDGEH